MNPLEETEDDRQFAQQLRQLVPVAGAIHRDQLLYEAGRQSVKPSKIWPRLVGVLAFSQACTLAWLFTAVPAKISPIPELPQPLLVHERVPPSPLVPWLALKEAESIPAEEMAPSEPIWTVHSFQSFEIQ